ncbi:MAG: hypothetical protein JWQ94_3600 [Tardiphaga sp.]|jgi:hypothetical protein|nr:hypothetical protein [Tardiphaga sp.]
MPYLEQAIRERAYHLWLADGCRDGAADAYWLTAQRELLNASLTQADIVNTSALPVAATSKKAPSKAKAAKSDGAKVTAPLKSKRRAA